MTFRLQKVDELSFRDHYHLENGDECWYFGEYTAYQDWSFSDTNQLIKNFKKKMSLRGTPQWPHKINAIRKVGELLASALNPNLTGVILIPVPPSRIVGDPEYDPRLMDALNVASRRLGRRLPTCECISLLQNAEPDHESDTTRLYPVERARAYRLHPELIPQGVTSAVIFDDVLTTGSHFKGAEIAIKSMIPNVRVSGIFVSRRVHENPFEGLDIDFSYIL